MRKAAVLFHDSVNRRQPHTRAFSRFFRREERLEDALLGFRVHSHSRVSHREESIGPRHHWRMPARIVLV